MQNSYKTLAFLCCVFIYSTLSAQVNFDSEKYKAVLYRVNAGGVTATVSDGTGVNWANDNFTNPCGCVNSLATGNKVFTTDDPITFDSSVPDDYPQSLFQEERSIDGWDPKRMEWNFPVESGIKVEVRVFMAEIFHNSIDNRHFDIEIDGKLVENDIDLYKDYGHDVGIMKTYQITTDDNIDLSFITIGGQPTVAAIEILELNDVTGTINSQIYQSTKVYPNPFNNIITLEKNSYSEEEISIYSTLGKPVGNWNVKESENTYQIETSLLPRGIYILKLGDSKYIIEKY